MEGPRQLAVKRWLYDLLVPEARPKGISWLNLLIISVVIASFLFLALETEPTMGPAWKTAIAVFNIAVVIFFAVEYVLRVWVNDLDEKHDKLSGRLRYMANPYSIADLLAFLPELLWLLFAPDTANEQVIEFLRVLRLARLVKIARFVPAFDVLGSALTRAGSQLLTTLAMALALVYIAAVALYFVEGVGGEQQESFASIPRAVWWAIATLTTVGYGDVFPVTPLGRFFSSIIALAGIGVVALPAGIFASAFSDELRERELAKLHDDVEELTQEVEELEAVVEKSEN